MNSCKGCIGKLLLASAVLAVGVFFVWAQLTQDLEQFGTVQHVRDGQVKSNPICTLAMIGASVAMFLAVMVAFHGAQKEVVKVGARAERHGGDPIAPVTKAARSGCGTAFALLALLALPLIFALAWAMGGS